MAESPTEGGPQEPRPGHVVPTSLADRILVAWTAWVHRWYLPVIVVSVLLTVATFLALSRIQVSTDVASLLPDHSPAIQALLELEESFDAARVVAVAHSDDRPVTDYLPYLDLVVDIAAEDELVKRVEYRILDEFPVDEILPYLPLMLDEQELERFVEKLEPETIRRQIQIDKRALVSVPSPAVKEMLQQDPLMLLEVLLDRLGRGRGGFRMDVSEGYFQSEDGRTMLFFLWPKGSVDDLDFDKELLARLDRIPAEAREIYLEEGYGDAGDLEGLEIGFTGPHLIAAIESNVIRREGQRAVLISLIGVLILFALSFGRIGSILYVGLPLLMGVVWSLGFSYLAVGQLNLVTSGFAAVVLGLGVDFAIHIFNRFLDHRAEDFSTLESLEVSVMETGKGVLTGGLTTAMAFFSMTLYNFKGIREFGLITGTGILFSLLSMFTVLPAMLVARSRWRRRFHFRRLSSFGMAPLGDRILAHYRPVLVVCVVATVVLGAFVPRISWSSRVGGDERYEINEALRLQRQVRNTFGGTFKNLIVLLKSEDVEALSRTGREVQQRVGAFADSEMLSSADSVWQWLAPSAEQEARMDHLREQGVTWETVQPALEDALHREGFRPEAFRHYEELLASSLTRQTPLGLADLVEMHGVPFLDAYVARRDDGALAATVYLYPREENFVPEDLEAIRAALRDILGSDGPVEAHLIGDAVLGQELKQRTRSGFFAVTLSAFFLVLGVLFLHFRHPLRVLLALTPLVSSVLWLLGGMSLFGVQINVMNVAVTPMLLGIGIDDAVHMLNSYLHEGKNDLHRVFVLTGKAVALTSLTTCVGFGSLAFADHPGLASMGTLAIWGVALAFVSTITFMPALLLVLRKWVH